MGRGAILTPWLDHYPSIRPRALAEELAPPGCERPRTTMCPHSPRKKSKTHHRDHGGKTPRPVTLPRLPESKGSLSQSTGSQDRPARARNASFRNSPC